jgi:hypothetical protein
VTFITNSVPVAIDKGTSAPVGPYQITVLSSAAGTAVFRVVASS